MAKQQEEMPGRLLLTVEEAAKCLSMCVRSVHTLVQRREIVSIKIGRMRRIPVQALDNFISRYMEEEQTMSEWSSPTSHARNGAMVGLPLIPPWEE